MSEFSAAGRAQTPDKDAFRDTFNAVNDTGGRVWFYPQQPAGKWHRRRAVFAAFALGLLFAGPFIKVGGQPLLLFQVLERKFIIFGIFIGPQDYWLFGLAMLCFMVFIVLFTAVFGRLWCGWACPQTVFMEMVFRKIEYAIEGNPSARKRLDNGPWTREKIGKKALKYTTFALLSFIIANLLLAYILGADALLQIVREPLADHAALFGSLAFFSAVFCFNFSWLRDQACTVVCPYGRLQSVLLDKNSISVAYDHGRGEPREKWRKNVTRTSGDCIDCHQCVAVCPTGIDIRNGLQMECVNCTACIDACDHIMAKTGQPAGLIRYTSENAIEKKTNQLFTPRIAGYLAVLILLWGGFAYLIATRDHTQTTLFRAPGTGYMIDPDGTISNLYTFKIFNKTNQELRPEIRLGEGNGKLTIVGQSALYLPPAGMAEGSLFITMPASAFSRRKNTVHLSVYVNKKKTESFRTTFIAPEGPL
ncbi:cytochrome c oxidase accessory protein CcoG [Dyadobacter sandarakinus]|uniref:Cytochrome c oxidase accessory protein CcoG n=2 Tax=Dyadobacter sandarakinus TaxID=2747268 RepID=A0ABX7IFA1_9BACT|nr:cytochrome c oxidase accessory protein CcoG [Dyadobacter sandarakinus]